MATKKERRLAAKISGSAGRKERSRRTDPELGREQFFEQAIEYAALLGVQARDAVYVVSTKDRGVALNLFIKRGRGEMGRLEIALAVLGEIGARDRLLERAILDVGANIGTTSIHALTSVGFARAVAIEPEPENFRLLRINVIANDLEDRFRVLRYAVSDEEGTARLAVPPAKSGSSRIRSSSRPPREGDISVPQTTLDALVAKGVFSPEEIGLLWLDVQGHEGHVLRKAQSLTSRGIPIVLEFSLRLLRRTGGLEWVREALRANYTDVVDLRHTSGDPVFVPIGQLDELAQQYGESDTDLLVVRRSSATSERTERPREDHS